MTGTSRNNHLEMMEMMQMKNKQADVFGFKTAFFPAIARIIR